MYVSTTQIFPLSFFISNENTGGLSIGDGWIFWQWLRHSATFWGPVLKADNNHTSMPLDESS